MIEMNDRELQDLLKSWEAPATPTALKGSVLEQYRKRQKWSWRWLFSGSLRVPVPVVSLTTMIIIGLALAALARKTPHPLPPLPPQIITRVIEVPVIKERIVTRTVYRERAVSAPISGINLREFQPVATLVPRIIRSGQDVNQN